MGDMTTPDFDDLLAAFDIPDLDPKDTMDSGQEDVPVKQAPVAAGKAPPIEPTAAPPEEPAVSVIVKNSLSPKPCDAVPLPVPTGSEAACHFDAAPMHNGFELASVPSSPKLPSPASDCDSWVGRPGRVGVAHREEEAEGPPVLSPAAVKTEEHSDEERDLRFSPCSTLFPVAPDPETANPDEEVAKDLAPGYPREFGAGVKKQRQEGSSEEEEEEKPSDMESEVGSEPEGSPSEDPREARNDPPSPPAPVSPELPWPATMGGTSPRSPEETAMDLGDPKSPSPPIPCRPIKEEPESPHSGLSEGSPSTGTSRPLKVRIKTIKTSTGGITRTVTRVSSDGELRSSGECGDEEAEEEEADEEEEEGGQVRRPPVEEEETPLPSQHEGTEALSRAALAEGPVLPTSTFQDASSAMLMAASIAQRATQLPSKGAAKAVSKSVHLASLNLVPQSLPAPVVAAGTPSKPLALGSSYLTSTTPQLCKAGPGANGSAVRSQTPLVEAFHRLLNGKNPLPTYKPDLSPPADSCLALPPSGYRCLECGDAFALEKSLARHYGRRSLRIDVTCNHCARRIVFYNRCSLLLHAREHKDRGLVMQCSNLVMKPIALDQLVGQPDPTSPTHAAAISSQPATGAGSRGAGAEQALPVVPPIPDPALVDCDTSSCSECGQLFPDRVGLAAHFQLETPSSAAQVCQLCQMLLPSKCSYLAHYRLHKNKSPYICPECGGVCRPAHIQAHVKEVCFHFTRKVGYKCPQCGVVYGGINTIKSHIQDVHCEAFHKCPICPMAFKSAPSAHSHIYTQHPGVVSQQAKVIHKCAMCDTVFTHQPLLSAHFDQHLTKQRVAVFKCPQCPVLYAQKRTMMEHVKSTHSSLKSEEPVQSQPATPVKPAPKSSPDSVDSLTDESSSSPKDVLSLQRRKEMRLKLKNAGWTCSQCQMWFPEREEYVTHMKKDHGKAMKKFPCRLCERSFCSAPSLRRHVRVNHEGIKRVYNCRHCIKGKRTFSSRLTLEKHLQVIHGINLADHIQDQENLFERVSIKTTIRKRAASRDGLEHCASEGAKSRKVNGSSPYRCMKCGYTTGSFSDFHQHIPQHRTAASSHQCRQCGLCFAAHPSLTRHLFIVHGLKESEGPKSGVQAGESDSLHLEGRVICDVCGKLFDSEPLLKTHFRTHGMAFIKSKQNGLDK
ncbi:zinc finger protein 687-like [Mobula hypostoma]|uniref:zinc finger protein 687-like n=1 Tax=Mobula hypostoma TaxID=723540 RepID=UPI002FC33811